MLKQSFYFLCGLLVLLFWSSCREDFTFLPSTGQLEFSKDTVYLDTVFTNIGSSTYNLKVYNRSNQDIVIPSIQLGNTYNSHYRMTIDGQQGMDDGSENALGKVFKNIELLAKDSLYIFIETTIDFTKVPALKNQFLYTDAIVFDAGSNQQEVALVTLVKDAVFIYPQKYTTTDPNTGLEKQVIETLKFDIDGDGNEDETQIQGRFLEDQELHFTNEKPYVIYGYAAVGNNKTLVVDAGSRIHFHANSGLLVTRGGSLHINGDFSPDQDLLENEVIIQGDRLEPFFKAVPGQWGTIWLLDGSINNYINHTTIKNAAVGILTDGNQTQNKLKITNTQIYNASNFGILARGSAIDAENLVINNCGQSSFAGTFGGRYNFTHATLANYWSLSSRRHPVLYLNNYIVADDETVTTNALSAANFNNCIIYGNNTAEFTLDSKKESDFNFKFTNCLVKFQDNTNNFTGSYYDFNNAAHYEQLIFNTEPHFKNPAKNLLFIGENSAAIGQGSASFASQVPKDLLNKNRTTTPDLGAYQHIIFQED